MFSSTERGKRCGETQSVVSDLDANDGLWPSKKYIEMLRDEKNNSRNNETHNNDTDANMRYSKYSSRVYWKDTEHYIILAEIFFMIGSVALFGQAAQFCQFHKVF